MRQEYINKLKRISAGLLLITILTGCGKNQTNVSNNKNDNHDSSYVTNTNTPTGVIVKEITNTPTETTTNVPTEVPTNTPAPTSTPVPTNTPVETNNNLEDFKNGIRSNINEIKEYFQNGNGAEVLSTGKGYAIKFIDFIFYGGEISGITFDSLSEDFKEEMYQYLQELDYMIMAFDKDYKEDFGERYAVVKDFTSNKYNQAKNYIINKIGEEKYNDIINKKDEYWGIAKGKTKEYSGKILDFLDDKYQNWKNNDNND